MQRHIENFEGTRFAGDGRRTLNALPRHVLPGTLPMRIGRWNARMLIASFLRDGISVHSGMGSTMWAILEYCEEKKLPRRITGIAGEGFAVRLDTGT